MAKQVLTHIENANDPADVCDAMNTFISTNKIQQQNIISVTLSVSQLGPSTLPFNSYSLLIVYNG